MIEKRRVLVWVRYILAGCPGFLLYYVLLFSLTEYAGLWYLISAVIGGVANLVSNFLLQKYWTFKNNERGATHKQIMKYTFLFIGIGLINLGGLYVLTEWIGIWYMLAQLIVSTVLTSIGYLITKTIFKS